MRLGLVEYVGEKVGSFEVEKVGAKRLWAARPASADSLVQRRRWLPEDEARQYSSVPGFTVARWGSSMEEPLPDRRRREAKVERPAVTVPPAAPAVPLDTLLEGIGEAPFILSRSGMLHRRGCSKAPKKPIGEFWTLDDAATVSQFKRYHTWCLE